MIDFKLPTSDGSQKKQENSRKTSTSASLTMLKPLIMWVKTNWKILKEMRIPDHLSCLLRDLYAVQEATVRTKQGTTDSFQIGKGVHQGCIQSPCFFLTYTQSTSCEIPGWVKHKLEPRFPGEISITSDIQMLSPLWKTAKRN